MTDSDDVRSIRTLTERFQAAVRDRDVTTLEELLGDDFTLTTGRPGNEVRSRGEWLDMTQTAYRIDSFDFEDVTIQLYDGCAIVRSRYRQRARMSGESRDGSYRMTDVWVRDGDRWRLQARHAQPLGED